jgi:hypothetical protein
MTKTKQSKVKFQTTSAIDEHEILINDLFNKDQKMINPAERAFDFTSINRYESIFKYDNKNSLRRQHEYGVDSGI